MAQPGVKVIGQGTPLVFLHSSLSSSAQWLELALRLSDDFLCINIDLLGYGEAPDVSDPVNYSLKDETDRVLEIVESHISEQSFGIVGHSFGGAVGLRIAHLMGHRLSNMVLYEPVAFHLLDKDLDPFADIHAVSGSLAELSDEQAARTFVDYWNYPGFFDKMPNKVQQMFSDKIAKVQLDFQGLMGETYTVSDLSLAHCPVLVMEGRDSPLSSKTIAGLLQQQLPNVEHYVYGGGHMAPIQQGRAFAKVVEQYLRDIYS